MADEYRNRLAGELVARIAAGADAYPQKIDLARAIVLVVLLDRDAYHAASFLDDRILTPATRGAWLPLAQVKTAAARCRHLQPVHFIFHTGHVGSTLVSRLLDETGVVLPLREPLPLRSLAEAGDALGTAEALLSGPEFDSILELFVRLWGRGYPSTLCSVVKATSSAGRAAGAILGRHPAARAVYLNLRAEPYLATLLAGENSAIDLKGHGAERLRRLQKRTGLALQSLDSFSIGELAALGWLAESLSQADALERHRARVLAIDFDEFLSGVGAAMTRVAEHFGLAVDARFASQVECSPVLARYSKAPEHDYTPALRAEIIADSRRRNQAEIRRGMAWLAGMAKADPLAAQLANQAGI